MIDVFGPPYSSSKIRGEILSDDFAGWSLGKIRCTGVASVAYRTILPVVPISHRSVGESVNGLQFISRAPLGCKRFELRSVGGLPADIMLGIVRWGYWSPDDSLLESFIELGWDTFRSSGVSRLCDDLPNDRHLAVYARWYRDQVGWICTTS